MTAKFEVRPLQNGRWFEVDGVLDGGVPLGFSRLEATELCDALTRVLGDPLADALREWRDKWLADDRGVDACRREFDALLAQHTQEPT